MDSDQDQFTIQINDTFSFEPGDFTVSDPCAPWDIAISSGSSGTIELHGDDANIIINGTSLCKTLQSLNDRLAILQVNPELEAEFDELHALAEQYRALEKKLLEKKKTWNLLKNAN